MYICMYSEKVRSHGTIDRPGNHGSVLLFALPARIQRADILALASLASSG
jgi:hypothetical protein